MAIRSGQYLLEKTMLDLKLKATQEQKEKLLQYNEMLIEGLKKQRLIGERSAERIMGKQFFDSLFPLKVIDFNNRNKLLDLGSGAGLPGVPLKIMRPHLNITLLDANQRKVSFLRATVESLGLESVECLAGRAENWAREEGYREQYDVVTAKAVAKSAVLAELVLPMLKIDGIALLYKGSLGDQELEAAKRAIELCGGRLDSVWRYRLPSGERRAIYVLGKVEKTPHLYPRKVGKPAKRPLY